ncbi:MAG: TerC family protein [Xanthobacteraceae bacterium]
MDFLWQDITHGSFWIAVLQIIGVNIILSGDNAMVIALACMRLPPRERLWGMILGAGAAVLLRVLFTLVVAQAMTYPFLKIVGGALLFWVAIKLVVEDADGGDDDVEAAESIWRAVRIVVIADIIMSLDNVIAIAASAAIAAAQVDASHADAIKATLIVFGLATSVPLIVAGSAILMALLERYRILVWAGGALLGWVAGDVIITDPALAATQFAALFEQLHSWGGRVGALIVVGVGLGIIRRHRLLSVEEIWTSAAVLLWVVGDYAIELLLGTAEPAKLWVARLVLLLVIVSQYVVLHSHRILEHRLAESKPAEEA